MEAEPLCMSKITQPGPLPVVLKNCGIETPGQDRRQSQNVGEEHIIVQGGLCSGK